MVFLAILVGLMESFEVKLAHPESCRSYTRTCNRRQHVPSLTQYIKTSSTPNEDNASLFAKYPGTCREDQVGVNAPGNPTTKTFLF